MKHTYKNFLDTVTHQFVTLNSIPVWSSFFFFFTKWQLLILIMYHPTGYLIFRVEMEITLVIGRAAKEDGKMLRFRENCFVIIVVHWVIACHFVTNWIFVTYVVRLVTTLYVVGYLALVLG